MATNTPVIGTDAAPPPIVFTDAAALKVGELHTVVDAHDLQDGCGMNAVDPHPLRHGHPTGHLPRGVGEHDRQELRIRCPEGCSEGVPGGGGVHQRPGHG